MASDNTNRRSGGIANYEALKTAIANGETELVQELLADQSMQAMEKDYLLDLAKLNNNDAIISLLKDVPLKQQR